MKDPLEEIPKYVRYDFLIGIIGLILVGGGWYYLFNGPINITIPISLVTLGLFLIIWSFGEMWSNYRDNQEVIILQNLLEKKRLFEKMKNLITKRLQEAKSR